MGIRLKELGVLLICTLIIGLLFHQCTFEPHHEFISPRKAPEPISVSFIINDPTFNDPYYLVAPTRLIFKLKDLNNTIISSEITLNGRSIDSEIYRNGVEFGLNPHLMAIGSHSISMTFNVDTKSGSLANRLGAEYYVIKQTFTVIIDPTPPVFNSFEAGMENGYLQMKWSGTDKTNFVYKIKRTHYGRSLSDTLIQDTRINHYIEPGYVGGEIHYQVVASGVGFESVVGSGTIEHTPADFQIAKNDEGVPQFMWSNTYINPEKVQIYISDNNPVKNDLRIPLSPSGSIDLDVPTLGNDMRLYFDLYRTGYFSQRLQVHLYLPAIPNIKPFVQFEILNENKLILVTDEKIYRYNLKDIILEDSLSFAELGINSSRQIVFTPDKSKAYIWGNSFTFIGFDPLAFDKFTYHDVEFISKELTEPSARWSSFSLGSFSNTGLASLSFFGGVYYTMIFDIEKGIITWLSPKGDGIVPIISGDGKYFIKKIASIFEDEKAKIFKRENETFNIIGEIEGSDYIFNPDNTKIISFSKISPYHDLNTKFYNLLEEPQDPSNSYIFSKYVTIPNSLGNSDGLRRITYDPYTNYFAITYDSALKLMNASTLKYEKSIPGFRLDFSNNYILRPSGFIEAVK